MDIDRYSTKYEKILIKNVQKDYKVHKVWFILVNFNIYKSVYMIYKNLFKEENWYGIISLYRKISW